MSSKKTRAYRSTSRENQAKETRNRLLLTAKKLFETKGFDLVTIEEIANAAGISIPRVYSLFQSKRGILRTFLDEALPSKQHDALVQQVKLERSPAKRLALAAKIARQLYDAEKAQLALLRGLAILDPQLKLLEAEREARRYLRQDETTQEMAEKGVFTKGMSLTQVKDILWSFTGRDFYRMLVLERGWSSDQYEEWLAGSLIKLLLD